MNKLARDKLFIERCLNFLKPGGKLAIVVPRGTLKNYNDENVRRHILRKARVIAVVSLTGSMFKPFTNTKTCVLFVKKRPKELTNLKEAYNDPPIVFAVSTNPGKDKSGNLVRNDDGKVISDLPEITQYVRANAHWDFAEVANAAS